MFKPSPIPAAHVGLYTTNEVESRTGVPATTLRQWERRYGLPNPQRSANGYRLYSEVDLAHINFIRERLAEGISVSRAVELCQENLNTDGSRAAPPEPVAPPTPRSTPAQAHGLLDYVEGLLEASLKADYDRAGQILSSCYQRFTVEDVLTHVIEPVLYEIGELWQRGEITVAHEHQASTFLRGKLQALLDVVGQPSLGPSVVVACGPGENHEIGSLMLSVILRRAGVKVYYLGANTPLADLALYVRSTQVDALLISVGAAGPLAQLRAQLSELRGLEVPVYYGGAVFNTDPGLAAELEGRYLGANAQQAVRQLIVNIQAEQS